MLLNAQVPWRAFKPVAGYLRTNGLILNNNFAHRRDNGLRFGKLVSMPQGFTDAFRALYPSISKTDFIRATLRGEGGVSSSAIGLGSISATVTGVGTLTADSEMGATLAATITGIGTLTGTTKGVGSMGAVIDAGSRPSAFDIAQEVWQSQKAAYNAPGTMGNAINTASSGGVDLNALAQAVWEYVIEAGVTAEQAMRIYGAVLSGKVSGAGTGTEEFVGLDGTTVRVTSTVDASGNRTAVTVDGT
jgi:hypothetical protein